MNELEKIVQRMIEAGESEENIAKVIQEFNTSVEPEETEPVKTTPVEPDATAGEEKASDMESASEDGSLELIGPSETPEPDTSLVPYETVEDAERIRLDQKRENIGFLDNLASAVEGVPLEPKKGIKNFIAQSVLTGLEIFGVTEPEDRGKAFELLQKIKTPGLMMGESIPGQGIMIAEGESIEDIENQQAKLETESKKFQFGGPTEAIVGAVKNIREGDFGEAGENLFEAFESGLTGVVKSSPSLLAAAGGLGTLGLYGLSISGNKFAEEIEKNPDETLAMLNINALGSGAIEAGFELVTYRLLKGANIIKGKKGADAAKEYINRGIKKIGQAYGFTWLAEGGSEAATEVGLILYDQATLSRETTKLRSWEAFYRVGDGFILGSMMSTPIATMSELNAISPAVKSRAEMMLTPLPAKKTMENAAAQISNLQVDLNKAKSKASKEAIQSKMNDLYATIVKTKKDVSFVLDNMTSNELKALAKNQDQINKIIKSGRNESDKNVRKTLNSTLQNLQQENFNLFDNVNKRVLEENLVKDKEAASEIIDVENKF